jgi:hypothetical protein
MALWMAVWMAVAVAVAVGSMALWQWQQLSSIRSLQSTQNTVDSTMAVTQWQCVTVTQCHSGSGTVAVWMAVAVAVAVALTGRRLPRKARGGA